MQRAEFISRLKGKVGFGLSREEATSIIEKGREFADFYEETMLNVMFNSYQEAKTKFPGMTFDDFCKSHPFVIAS